MISLAVTALIVGAVLPASACGCDSKPLADLLEDADAVFVAVAPERSGLDPSRPFEVAVERVYKGYVGKTATIWASDGPLACGIDPAGAGEDGFIASTDDGRTSIGTCLPGFGVADIEEILGPGHLPGSTLAVSIGGNGLTVVLLAAAALIGLVPAVRRRIRSDPLEEDHRD
jgi:hypothetical protein